MSKPCRLRTDIDTFRTYWRSPGPGTIPRVTITQGAPPPTRNTPVALARGILTGGVIGASLAAFVVGCVIESVPLCVTGVGLPAVYGLLFLLAGMPRRAREAAIPPRTALAQIESLEAVGGEATSDVAVRFDVTVAPDEDIPAYRVQFTQHLNLADLPDYRPGGVVVVQYPPDRLWKVRIVKRPTPEWEERVVGAHLDSAPGPAVVSEPSAGCAVGFVTLLALLLAAAGVILLFRADLFDKDTSGQPPSSPEPSVSATSSTTVVTSASGTVALGPGQSFLDKGELRRAVDSLTKGKGKNTGQALTVVVQERLLSVVFTPPARRPRTSTRVPSPTNASPTWSRRPGPPSASVPRRPGRSPPTASPVPSPSGSA